MIRNVQSHSATLCPQIQPDSVGTLFHADCCTEVTVLFIQQLFRESLGYFSSRWNPLLQVPPSPSRWPHSETLWNSRKQMRSVWMWYPASACHMTAPVVLTLTPEAPTQIPVEFIITAPVQCTRPSSRPACTSPLHPCRASMDHSSPAARWQWRMGQRAAGTLPARDSYGSGSRLTVGATCQVVERARPLISSVTWPWQRGALVGGKGWGHRGRCHGDSHGRQIFNQELMGNEYIAHKLDGVWREAARVLMTHLWLAVTPGTDPLEDLSTCSVLLSQWERS